MIPELNPGTYEQFVSTKPVAVVHFWAAWNERLDRLLTPILDGLAKRRAGNVNVGRFCTDPETHQPLCKELGLINLPSVAYYSDGLLSEVVIGVATNTAMIDRVECLLRKGGFADTAQ